MAYVGNSVVSSYATIVYSRCIFERCLFSALYFRKIYMPLYSQFLDQSGRFSSSRLIHKEQLGSIIPALLKALKNIRQK